MLILSISNASLQGILRAAGTGEKPPFRMLSKIIGLLQSGPISMPDLAAQVLDGADLGRQAMLLFVLRCLVRTGLLDVEIVSDKTRLARVFGALPDCSAVLRRPTLRLSRFASIRPHERWLLVESPFCPANVVLLAEQSCLVCAKLVQGATLAELAALPCVTVDQEALEELVMSLAAAGALEEQDASDDSALVQWEHHDAMFHARTRGGRAFAAQGGSYRFYGKRAPEPAIPSRVFGESQKLPEAPLPSEAAALQNLMQQRQSLRTYGSRPISAAELGALLRLVARNHSDRLVSSQPRSAYEVLFRAYPSAGGCHELHIYPVVNRCEGLARGIYCYDGTSDQLYTVAAMNQACERLIQDAAYSMGGGSTPDILLCIAARFGRVNWKYEGIAYSLILKNVGVLLQTLYLAATALRLAPCALGCGNTKHFLLATGNRPFEEESVGEFALGSRQILADS